MQIYSHTHTFFHTLTQQQSPTKYFISHLAWSKRRDHLLRTTQDCVPPSTSCSHTLSSQIKSSEVDNSAYLVDRMPPWSLAPLVHEQERLYQMNIHECFHVNAAMHSRVYILGCTFYTHTEYTKSYIIAETSAANNKSTILG